MDLKPLSKEAIPAALDKAVRYRLLNEPLQSESICLDILAAEPGHQKALKTLILALTDQFDSRLTQGIQDIRELLPQLESGYARAYYEGIAFERRANAQHSTGAPGCGQLAYEGLMSALACYEKAIELRAAGNDEAVLRWNACKRVMHRFHEIQPPHEDNFHPLLE